MIDDKMIFTSKHTVFRPLPWQHATDENNIYLSKSYDPSGKIAAASLSTPTTWNSRRCYFSTYLPDPPGIRSIGSLSDFVR